MAYSPESISKLKTDYEAKIAKMPKAARGPAKNAWNKIIDAALVALTAQLTALKSAKLLDKVTIGVAVGAASKLKGVVGNFKSKVKAPMSKVLKGANSSETKELSDTISTMGSNASNEESVALNNAGRAEASAKKMDLSINTLEANINSLNKLKL